MFVKVRLGILVFVVLSKQSLFELYFSFAETMKTTLARIRSSSQHRIALQLHGTPTPTILVLDRTLFSVCSIIVNLVQQ